MRKQAAVTWSNRTAVTGQGHRRNVVQPGWNSCICCQDLNPHTILLPDLPQNGVYNALAAVTNQKTTECWGMESSFQSKCLRRRAGVRADRDAAVAGGSCGRLTSTCPGKGDSRHRREQIAAMWGGGPSAAGSSKFSKGAKKLDFYVKPPISKCCLKFLNIPCGAKYIGGPPACDHVHNRSHETQTHTPLSRSFKTHLLLFSQIGSCKKNQQTLAFLFFFMQNFKY